MDVAVREPDLYRLLKYQVPNLTSLFQCLGPTSVSQGPRLSLWKIRNICFYGEELLAPRLTTKLEYHPLSAVCECLFNMKKCHKGPNVPLLQTCNVYLDYLLNAVCLPWLFAECCIHICNVMTCGKDCRHMTYISVNKVKAKSLNLAGIWKDNHTVIYFVCEMYRGWTK